MALAGRSCPLARVSVLATQPLVPRAVPLTTAVQSEPGTATGFDTVKLLLTGWAAL